MLTYGKYPIPEIQPCRCTIPRLAAAVQSLKTGMQYRRLFAAIGSSQLELDKLPAGFGLTAMTFKLGPKAMSLVQYSEH